jgi:hypothetical protein
MSLFTPYGSDNGYLPYQGPDVPAVATFVDTFSNITYKFPFNLNSLNWNYNLNTQNYSTIAGRVTQLLSVSITTVYIQGDAGSRGALLKMFEQFKTMQDDQNSHKKHIMFSVPSQNLHFAVWLESFQMGWDYTTVTYPYSITVQVDQTISKSAIDATTKAALNYIVNITNNGGGIGFSSAWTGLSKADVNFQYQDILNGIQSGIIQQTSPPNG